MNRIVERLTQFLSAPSVPMLGSANISSNQPASSSDLPSLVISLRIEDVKGIGLGGFVREGHSPTKSISSIQIHETEDTFLPGLKVLRILPLPLIRNPNSTGDSFSDQDIQIRDITNPAAPHEYFLTNNPSRADQFFVYPSRGEIIFGQAQTEGNLLELIHWSLTWREDIHVDRFNGLVKIEVWAGNLNEINKIVDCSLIKLRSQPDALRQLGFRRFLPAGLGPISQTRWEPAIGSATFVCRQAMEFRFTAEIEQGGEISSGSIIRHIEVAMDERVDEQFSVPQHIEIESE